MKHRGLGVSESLCKAPPRLTGILFNDNLQGVEIEDRRASRARFVFQLQVSVLEAFEPPGGRHMGDCAEAHRLVDSKDAFEIKIRIIDQKNSAETDASSFCYGD
ncbi:hypothetical protein WR25_00620 [Diploscapter pachys]|uniref:Uncharacterized protein n=1 Tax=Diploscapter pachys TaxID=2018661 RepID=A0A2A2LG81_9BILA|nr:hypothetical protein WR25_00620 [Diploscapter pachys]